MHLKLIKSDRRSSLGEDQFDQLLRITVDVSKWDASGAVQLCWGDKTPRPQTIGIQIIIPSTSAGPSTSPHLQCCVDDDTKGL